MKNFAILTTENWTKNPNTKTTYILESVKTETISSEQHYNLTNSDTCKFFRRLGGTETVEKSYTSRGYICTKLTSTSPDKTTKKVRKFEILD